ncbi:MAG: hypothetical protein EHM33_09225 [Chloroflexi bacterium]|nr:MAG: hypothetical protein EHM33_09225 [Chloroflexota bacterium]
MKNKISVLLGGLLVALVVVAVIGATNAYAQTPSNGPLHGRGPGGGRGPMGGAGLEAAAQALNMTTDELTAALKSGKTLEQVAEEAGVDFADVQAAMQAARETEMRARIQQALDDGTITQENADWLLEGLDKGFLGGPGGFGMGFGGPHGRGPGTVPEVQPTQDGGQ